MTRIPDNGDEPGGGGIVPEGLAQVADVDVDDTIGSEVVPAPHPLQELSTSEHSSWCRRQGGEKVELEGAHSHCPRFGGDLATRQVDADPVNGQLDAVVARHIRHVLGTTGGKIHGSGGAGELLGVNPNTLRAKMRKLGIPFRKELQPKA